jgi:hypothetical protein
MRTGFRQKQTQRSGIIQPGWLADGVAFCIQEGDQKRPTSLLAFRRQDIVPETLAAGAELRHQPIEKSTTRTRRDGLGRALRVSHFARATPADLT